MRVALINPAWRFDGSVYFGCREPHLPLEFGYARALLEAEGHQVEIIDGQLESLDTERIASRVKKFAPEMTVVTTTPSYLFWRCPPPELRIPIETMRALRDVAGTKVIVGPHGSTTPRATLEKLGADAVVRGECEEVLREIVRRGGEFDGIASLAWNDRHGTMHIQGTSATCDLDALPALKWSDQTIRAHRHHHHRFDVEHPDRPGGEVEASRGCPYRCTFCAKTDHRDKYRTRPTPIVLEEIDSLVAQGVEYVYFIDEIFLPDKELLDALVQRRMKFGVQTRIDLWSLEMLDLLGRAGCVSIEAGVESITREGREMLVKKCKLSTEELAEKLIHAKKSVAFVQATLMQSQSDDEREVEKWRDHLREHGVWANKPVPLFPYPGSPDYIARWGEPDDRAWERAHASYLGQFDDFSDVQERRPVRLPILEGTET